MSTVQHPRWILTLEDVLTRPRVERAVLVMTLFSAAQVGASLLCIWLVGHSGQVRMSYFAPVVLAGVIGVIVSAVVLAFLAPRDPEGRTLPSRLALAATALGYSLFGVAIAYIFGFWASPFLLFPAVTGLLFGILFGRTFGIISIVGAVGVTAIIEGLRFGGLIDYAPALVEDSVQGSGTLERLLGTGGPLLVFVVAAMVLAFGTLAVVDHQREALARSHELIRTYVPAQVADAVLEHGETSTRLERRKITVFFSDIVGFTETTERMEPEDLALVLGEYFSEMARIAARHDGTIDELVGDAVLIFFGAPTATTDRDHALRAMRMAIEMQIAVDGLNERWEQAGLDVVFRIRMGVNTGVVAVGNVGSGARQKYAAIGRAVNLASRIQSECPPGSVLMTRATWLLVREEFEATQHGEVELKGVGRTTPLYAITPEAAGTQPEADGPLASEIEPPQRG
ncbi:adenylate/guanylate cyclase domain-containing protein [Aeromicrobium alkaliterrae]|uniref:Guanylate cyclase domain-containing protein n=1 Tax=Aeromicrobium alkaliterrae TaxID=302168 RepID=A0ABN2JXP6_9ACTN